MDKDDAVQIDSVLQVYGNANNDYVIDDKDMSELDKYLALTDDKEKEEMLSEQPYLDTNCDGTVDKKDKELLQKILDKEPCTVYHVNACSSGDYVVSTKWPISSCIMTGAANMLLLSIMAGIDDMVHGITYSSSSAPDPALFPKYSQMKSIGGTSTSMPVENASTIITENHVTALISAYTESTVDKKTVEPVYEEMGVDVVRINAAYVDAEKFGTQLFLLGFLFQTEDKCKDIISWWIALQDEINDKLDSVKTKKTVITSNSDYTSKGVWISAGKSDYVDVMTSAGGVYGIPAADLSGFSTYSSGAYFIKSQTWLYNYDFDYIISIRTGGWYSGNVDDTVKYDKSLKGFDMTESYQNHKAYVIVGDGPVPIRIAYAASVMYPDLFSEDWADKKNAELMGMLGYDLDISKLHFVISYDMAHPSA